MLFKFVLNRVQEWLKFKFTILKIAKGRFPINTGSLKMIVPSHLALKTHTNFGCAPPASQR
jgi:hypothetical protein